MRYRNIKHITPISTNCLIFAIWYWFNKGGKLCAEFDTKICFWHFFIRKGDKEIHYEQRNRRALWLPIIKGKIKIYQTT